MESVDLQTRATQWRDQYEVERESTESSLWIQIILHLQGVESENIVFFDYHSWKWSEVSKTLDVIEALIGA